MSEEGRTVFNGRYELLRRIARGGMADVYLARDVSLDRQVAVKVLFSEFANDPSFVERFRREAKAAANLSHPNIIGIFDWGQEQGTYYIVMEYVEGRSMADVLRSTGPLSPDRAAEIASNVADALASAHSAGLVHRDVKLGNIIVSDEGQVKVADFGIATALARRTGDNLTQIGSVMGTATYFSPEQAQGKPLDGRSDLYSLGVVLYEMIVGRPPFAADTPTAVAVKHVQESPQRPSQAGANIAESLEAIILKLLAKNPGNRYPEAADLRSDLRRYLSGAHRIPKRPGAATPSGAGQTDPASDSQRRRAGPSAPEGASAAEGGPSRQRTARGAARGPSTPSAHDAPRPPSGPGVPWSQKISYRSFFAGAIRGCGRSAFDRALSGGRWWRSSAVRAARRGRRRCSRATGVHAARLLLRGGSPLRQLEAHSDAARVVGGASGSPRRARGVLLPGSGESTTRPSPRLSKTTTTRWSWSRFRI